MPTDPSMMAAADSVQMQETARYFYEQRHGAGGSFGRLDDVLAEHKEELEKLIGDLPFEDAYPEIERFCLDRDIRIFHAEHGRCLIGVNPDKARCHEASGTSSWRNAKPNHLTRTPSMCAGCINFSVSATTAKFWRRRYVSHQTAWIESDQNRQFVVIRKRAEQAQMVLKALGVVPPIILARTPTEERLKSEKSKASRRERVAPEKPSIGAGGEG